MNKRLKETMNERKEEGKKRRKIKRKKKEDVFLLCVVYLTTPSVAQIIEGRMKAELVNNELRSDRDVT
jgi:hypothetical protein